MGHDTDDDANADTHDEPPVPDATPATVHTSWNGDEAPSEALVDAVAAATNNSPTDLPPLYRTVDVDALDAVISNGASSAAEISFSYAGTEVRLTAAGDIHVRVDGTGPADED